MPISELDGCPASHWTDVKVILNEAIEAAGFEPNLVSSDADVGIIQKRIVENLYNNPITVCDISGRNANVMFELGMRLAFDKPVIIVKDDKTPYSFDTSPIEHLEYPRDLRFGLIRDFKDKLTEKINNSIKNKNSFLKSFGTFKIAELDEKEVGATEFILDELSGIKSTLSRLYREQEKLNVLTEVLQNERRYFARSLGVSSLSSISSEDEFKDRQSSGTLGPTDNRKLKF
jgi:hypothetical protein